jgi:hypothetical protein
MLLRAIIATVITALLAGLQYWTGLGTTVPQPVWQGINILAVIIQILHAYQSDPATGRFLGWRSKAGHGPRPPTAPFSTLAILGALCLVAPVAAVGCAAFLPTILTVLQEVDAALPLAQAIEAAIVAAWPAIYATIPTASQAQAQADFNNAKASLDDSIAALAELAAAGQDASQQNLLAALSNLGVAVQQFYNAITVWTNAPSNANQFTAVQTRITGHVMNFQATVTRIKSQLQK